LVQRGDRALHDQGCGRATSRRARQGWALAETIAAHNPTAKEPGTAFHFAAPALCRASTSLRSAHIVRRGWPGHRRAKHAVLSTGMSRPAAESVLGKETRRPHQAT